MNFSGIRVDLNASLSSCNCIVSNMDGAMGICGRSCSGVEGVDTIGVYEFDTKSESVVATHLLADGFGGEPFLSPDGSKFPNKTKKH